MYFPEVTEKIDSFDENKPYADFQIDVARVDERLRDIEGVYPHSTQNMAQRVTDAISGVNSKEDSEYLDFPTEMIRKNSKIDTIRSLQEGRSIAYFFYKLSDKFGLGDLFLSFLEKSEKESKE